ncbi:S-layer family protein [Deinococcus sp. JMULE3]|uniref:beta strand repeat-containing protein n=1 Tax=Deinococcus sp. JMULE3 TaxID=2518341 RepID=UPI00157697AE|nr:isopeptide-forming domain-containing fimbrial protein [Deinococcus sp. JMULE3]NTY02256.1 DUF11 domain-containing protein [Deinococcus sp. JMULE3]
MITTLRPGHSGLSRFCSAVLALILVLAGSAGAQTTFSSRYTNTATNGDIVLIGNVNYHCTTVSPASAAQITACNTARSGGTTTNNSVYMVPIDLDGDAATTNSSSASLNLGAGSSVLFAGLYWSGISSSATNRAGVRLATPATGTSVALTASRTSVIGSNYQSFVDVTTLVQAGGSGTYTVGNIASNAGASSWAGWSLVVAYRNSSLPTRNLAVFDGFLQASDPAAPLDIGVSGFVTPSVGTVRSTIGVVAWDGDRGQQEGASATPQGSLRFGPNTASLSTVSNTVNTVNDVFNSTISVTSGAAGGGSNVVTGQVPNFTNTLGVDIDTFTPNTALPNGSTSAVVRVVGTSSDVIFPGVVTLATEIFVPNIKDALTKTVTDLNGGQLIPGDTLEYELVVRNQGNDGALNVILTDPLPAGTTFVPGSLVITGANAGSKTDVSGDDQAEYDPAGRTVTFRLGTGATATAGGAVLPGEESRVRFRVTVNAGTAGGTVISNTGTVTYRQQTLGTVVSDTSDSDPVTAGDQPAVITVAGPDLTVDKFHSGSFQAGANGTFTLRVTNAGPAPTTGQTVTVTDTLPAGMTAVALAGSGWTCTLSPLRCTRSDALAAGSSYPDLLLTVTSAAGSFTNTAAVTGGGEATAQTGNNGDSDSVTVQPSLPPSVALTKSVRNVTRGGGAGTSSVAQPGEVLEYCIAYVNSGGAALNFVLSDTAPASTLTRTSAYGVGLGIQVTQSGVTLLTSASDADAGSLVGQLLTFRVGSMPAGDSGTVCFQVQVR